MKKILFIVALIFFSHRLLAQTMAEPADTMQPLQPVSSTPAATRKVSGMVKNLGGQVVVGASVRLESASDTLKTSTNAEGVFIFQNVKRPKFAIFISHKGYIGFVKRYLRNEVSKAIVLPPTILKPPVKINPI